MLANMPFTFNGFWTKENLMFLSIGSKMSLRCKGMGIQFFLLLPYRPWSNALHGKNGLSSSMNPMNNEGFDLQLNLKKVWPNVCERWCCCNRGLLNGLKHKYFEHKCCQYQKSIYFGFLFQRKSFRIVANISCFNYLCV